MKNKKWTKDGVLLILTEVIFTITIPILLVLGMAYYSLTIVEEIEESFGQNRLIIYSIFIICIAIFCGLISLSILIGKKIKDRILHIPEGSICVLSHGSATVVKYMNKYEFLIRKSIKDITERDFQEDKKGRALSYIDKNRVFHNFYLYKQKEINKNEIKETIINNKELLRELLANSNGIKKAEEREIRNLNKRITGNRKLLLLSLIAFVPLMHGVDFYVVICMFCCCLLLGISYLIIHGCKLFAVRNGIYYFMECNICDKVKVYRSSSGRRAIEIYKVRCRDKEGYFLDDWFECEYKTYNEKDKTNIVIVQKGNKIYINSYDKLWTSRPKIIKL